MPTAVVRIEGLEQLNRRLEALTRVARQPILAKALKARAEIIRDAAKSGAPRSTGALQADIFVGPSIVGGNLYESTVEVGTGKDVFYGYFVHFGTGTSFDAAAARALGYPGRSKSNRRNYPGIPFLTDAVKSTQAASIAAVENVLEQEIRKAETT